MDFKGAALRPVTADEVRLIAGYLGVEIAAMKAVMAVEAAGKGFGADGRPIILPERHKFWKYLGAGPKRDEAVRRKLASKVPGGYPRTQEARYARLAEWTEIDETAALMSCSWGLGQVMGFNHEACGFPTVQAMVRAMCHSEGAQLYAMARFIVSNSLQASLRARRWATFARRYNGPAYKKNRYDEKLAEAYAKRPKTDRVVPPPTTIAALAVAFDPDLAAAPRPSLDPVVMPPPPARAAPATESPANEPEPDNPWIPLLTGAVLLAIAIVAFLYMTGA